MAYRFKVTNGQVIERDRSKPILDGEGKETGRYEQRVYNKGDVVDSEVDLAARHANKFELVETGARASDAKRVRELEAEVARLKAQLPPANAPAPIENPSAFPGGQVSSGFQVASGPQGSRPMTADEAARLGILPAPDDDEADPKPKKGQAKAASGDEADDEGKAKKAGHGGHHGHAKGK